MTKKKKKNNNYHYTAYLAIQDWVVTLVKVKADMHSKESTMSVKYYALFNLKELLTSRIQMYNKQD